MNAPRKSEIEVHGTAEHSARISQQGQGYQLNIDQVFFGVQPLRSSPWHEQFDGWPTVRDVDPLEIGVHRASVSHGNAVPAYVSRDDDSIVRDLMLQALRHGGMVLLVGDSTAGKSRSAYESLLSTAPNRRLFGPGDREHLMNGLVALTGNAGDCVLWLDDLEQYIGQGGLSPKVLTHLKRASVPVLATMRSEQYRRFIGSPSGAGELDRHVKSDFQRIVDQSRSMMLSRLWSQTEISRAGESNDPRIHAALEHSSTFGVSEYLAAGPALFDEWKMAWGIEANPRGASLIAAAVDFARAGLDVSVPKDLIVELHHEYLDGAGGDLLRPEDLERAFSWATRRRAGVASPLMPVSGGASYRAFDYLVDSVMRKKPSQKIPISVWRRALDYAGAEVDLLYSISSAARRLHQRDIEQTGLRLLVDAGDPRGAMRIGSIHRWAGEANEAIQWFERAAEMGDPEGWVAWGLVVERYQRNYKLAEDLYMRAANAGNAHGMGHLSSILRRRGEVGRSEGWLRKALSMEPKPEHHIAFNLATLLTDVGRLDEAEVYFREAIERGDKSAIAGLGVLLARSSRIEEARSLWQQAVDQGVANGAAQLAMDAEVQNDAGAAEKWWRKAIELGSEDALIGLAIMLADMKPSASKEIDELFRRAIDRNADGAASNYSVYLRRRRRYDEAEKWAQAAVDEGDLRAARTIAEIREDKGGSEAELRELWQRSAEAGDATAQARLGGYLYDCKEYEEARTWLIRALEVDGSHVELAACDLGNACMQLGDLDMAEHYLLKSLDVGHAHAACRLGALMDVSWDRTADAIEYFKASYYGGHSHAAEMLRSIYLRCGQGKEAAEWLRRSKERASRKKRRGLSAGSKKSTSSKKKHRR